MSVDSLKIGFVAPPFAGHLHPQLELASGLRDRGLRDIRFFSTPEAKQAVELSGFKLESVLADTSNRVVDIANTRQRIGSNPLRLMRQLRMNLSLLEQLRSELRSHWQAKRPDLIVADMTVPVAGLLARELGIHWWSTLPTICVLETPDGTPSYVGGWSPPSNQIGRLRDAIGRKTIRVFKRTVHRLFRSQASSLGLRSVYREDGSENIYSPELILGLGMRELEFECTWPSQLEFTGPLTGSPTYTHEAPQFQIGKPHVLVSLGTHLGWAKSDAMKLMREVAKQLPECVFHFSLGNTNDENASVRNEHGGSQTANFQTYDYVSYEKHLSQYAASINHCGTGVMYACLKERVPILAWPQDYDQFDHSARIVHHGLGLRLRPRVADVVRDLRFLMGDKPTADRLAEFQSTALRYDAAEFVWQRLQQFAKTEASGVQDSEI